MPQIKIKIDDREYSLFCEEGEEGELENAANLVNEKMNLFKEETDIPLTKKFLMISLLLASELNLSKENSLDFNELNEINDLLKKLEETIENR